MKDTETALQESNAARQEQDNQLAKDIAYTINHAFACTAVDWLGQAPALVAVQKMFGAKKPVHIGCNNPFHQHDHHHHDHHHDHHHHHAHHSPQALQEHAKHISVLGQMFTASEIIGDFAGIIPTVLMQRYTPWALDGIRPLLRAVMGPLFHYGAALSSKRWAREQGVSEDSQEYKTHLEEIYDHEMHHLPQAAWWTVWSSGFNVALQAPLYEYLATPQIRSEFPLGDLKQRIITKLGGASLSIGLVLGWRALFPQSAHRFTDWTEQHLVTPATRIAGRTIGLDSSAVDEAIELKSKMHDGKWRNAAASKNERALAGVGI